MTEVKTFTELYRLPIAESSKLKAGKFTYLSWSDALQLALELDPNFTFEILPESVHEFDEELTETYTIKELVNKKEVEKQVVRVYKPTSLMCNTSATFFGVTKKMFLAVTNNANQAVINPTSDFVANSRMRCLVKNLALFGLGLHIYKGEDVPKDETIVEKVDTVKTIIETLEAQVEIAKLQTYFTSLDDKYKKDTAIKAVVKRKADELKTTTTK